MAWSQDERNRFGGNSQQVSYGLDGECCIYAEKERIIQCLDNEVFADG